MNTETHTPSDNETNDSAQPRRNMLTQLLAGGIGTLVGLVPFASGLAFFLGPLRKDKQASDGDGDYYPLNITADSLPADGTPQMVRVIADKVDAWNKYKDVPIGTVWLSKRDGEIKCFSTICPHLGCSVEFRTAKNDYYCPCHTSAFDLDGCKQNLIPPRDMDALKVRVNDGRLEVQYKNFRGATSEQIEA